MWNPLCIVFGHRKVSWKTGSIDLFEVKDGRHGSRTGTVVTHQKCIRRFCGWSREWWKRLPAQIVKEELSGFGFQILGE